MSALLRVPPNVEPVASTSGMASLTVTVSLCAPGSMVKSTRISWPTSSTTFSRASVLKPGNSTRTVYVPGISVGALYCPASSVVTVRARPLCVSTMLMLAPGKTAPVGSVTLPRMRPKLACANIAREKSNTTRAVMSTHPVILGFPVTAVIALSISNAPLSIGGGSTCISSCQNSTDTKSNVARRHRHRDDHHEQKETSDPSRFHIDVSYRYFPRGVRGISVNTIYVQH